MIPFTTCVVHGKTVTQWNDVTCRNKNSDDTQNVQTEKVMSIEKLDRNSLYIRMLGGVHSEASSDCVKHCLSHTDEQSLKSLEKKDYNPRFSKRLLSSGQLRRKRQPLHNLSPANTMLFDESYSGQAQCLLNKVGCWDFDIFKLDRFTNGRPVFTIAMHLFQHYDLINHFQLDIDKLVHCFKSIEEGYHTSNPYHNAVHAADVTQSMHCFLQEKTVMDKVSEHDILVTLLASMSHDIDHPGVNNSFLVATSNHLAALYQNVSVLENHHWRTAVGHIKQSGLLHKFSHSQWAAFCDDMRSLILATDITRQHEFISSFRKCLDDKAAFGDTSKLLMLQIALKCSDISNACREWSVSKLWSDSVCDEFFKQGDCELLLNIPVTPMCDKTVTSTPNIQIGFMQYVVEPLFSIWQHFSQSPLTMSMLHNLHSNIKKWRQWGHDHNRQGYVDEDDSGDDSSASSIHDLISSMTCLEPDDQVAITQYHSVVVCEGTSSPGRSLSPVCEDMPASLMRAITRRRHSMPISAIRKEHSRLTMRRESFPRTAHRRRYSLPRLNTATSYDHIVSKLQMLETGSCVNKSVSLDTLNMRPNVTNLSPNLEMSQVLSRASKYQWLHHTPHESVYKRMATSDECLNDVVGDIPADTDISVVVMGGGRRRASLPVSETAREYLTRQLVDVATLFSCLDPASSSYARTLAAATFYTNGHTAHAAAIGSCRSRSNSMFEMTQNQLSHIALLQQCSK